MGERKRRLSSAWGLKQGGALSDDDEVELMEPNDDELEKRSRVTIDVAASSSPLRAKNPNKLAELANSPKRDPLAAKKRKSVGWGVLHDKENHFPPGLPKAAPAPSLVANAHLSNDQLADLYSNCIKLSTENKINQKNSWQLNLIDYMEDVLEHQEVSGDNPNFQAASCTLDASVKIYSCRVDSVHTDTYKVLGGLTRTGDRGGAEGDDEQIGEEGGEDTLKSVENDGEKTEEVEKKKKPKKLAVGGVNTLEQNIEALNAKKIDLEFLIDPLFRKTSAAFDEGGAKGLLLNHLSVHHVHHGCELVFDSVDAVDVSSSFATADHNCDISDLQDLLASGGDLRDIADLEICPTFANFEFEHGKAPKVEKVELQDDAEPMVTEDNNVYGGSDGEVDDYAGGFDGGGIDFDAGGSDGEGAAGPPAVKFDFKKMEDDEQLVPGGVDPEMLANDAWSDFQHINPKLAKKWAGPEHWRFTSKTTNKSDGKTEGETKKRAKGEKKSKEFFIDFLAPPPPESAFAPPGRTLTTLSAAVLKKASEASTTLPVDVHYDLQMLTQLFSKPKWIIPPVSRRFRKTAPSEGAEGEGAERGENEPWYEYGNANDANFVNDDGNADDDDDHFGGDGFDGGMDHDGEAPKREEGEEEGEGEGEGEGENTAAGADYGGLVAEPAKVAKISINYAKVAKKVDVKALKSTMWTDLCDTPSASASKDKDKDKGKKDAKEQGKDKEVFDGARTFESLLSSVEQRAGKEVGEVSVALCFICMLHLCNEKGLSLAQEGIEDLQISSKT